MLEVIATSLEDVKRIEAGGADRIELVSAIALGGLTPSRAMIETVLDSTKLPVRVMIRPHDNGFSYNESTLKVMQKEIHLLNEYPLDGYVLGSLNNHGVDFSVMEDLLLQSKKPMTFHRAIDDSMCLLKDFRTLCNYDQITSILTSAGDNKANFESKLLMDLYECSAEKLLIGSGITLENINDFLERFPGVNIHMGSGLREDNRYDQAISINKIKEVKRRMLR
jgi:copper homeostasis protein